jgi:hypothetical protein
MLPSWGNSPNLYSALARSWGRNCPVRHPICDMGTCDFNARPISKRPLAWLAFQVNELHVAHDNASAGAVFLRLIDKSTNHALRKAREWEAGCSFRMGLRPLLST